MPASHKGLPQGVLCIHCQAASSTRTCTIACHRLTVPHSPSAALAALNSSLAALVSVCPVKLSAVCTMQLGRIAHVRVGGQVGADMKRVEAVLSRPEFKVESVPLAPGDALFFHCNVLHTSAQNLSPDRRYCLLVAYNRASNDPVSVWLCLLRWAPCCESQWPAIASCWGHRSLDRRCSAWAP